MTLDALFYPRGVAVVGSAAPGKIGYELIKQIRDGGYEQVYAVNPKAQGALGAPGYTSLSQIDDAVDLAVVVSPATTVPQVLEECGHAGIRAVVVITSGFAEVGNRAGEAEIRRIAQAHGIRLVGPNCAGIVNTHHRLFASLETRPPQGAVSFISQSGALGGAVLSWAEEQGLGLAKFLSYGNRADLDEIDLLPYLATDPETRVGALYIESVADGPRFLEAVRAFTAVKPLVVIKSGRTESGQRATLSHTGSLAGADAVYDAAFKACGAIRVATVEEMFDLCKGFVHLPRVRGRRVAIVTNSGGPGVLAADRAEAEGLEVCEPSAALREGLAARLPPYCSLKNPIDLTVEGTEASYRDTLCAVLEEYDAALALDVSTPYLDSLALARGVVAAARQTGKPIAANFMAGRVVAEAVAYLRAQGLADFATGERAVAVLARMAEYAERPTPAARPPIAETRQAQPLPGNGPLLEPEAMRWLRDNGLPVPEFRCASGVEQAVQASRELGYPVVMKVVSPDILHKSESGGVKVDLRDDDAARAAFASIERAAGGDDFRGVVIYPLVRGAQEVLVGLSRDPQFGPVVAFGLGGIYTEVLRDVALRIAPVNLQEAHAMIREIRAFPILAGMRGQAPCDLDALAGVLVKVSGLPFRYPEIAAMDLNPLFALPHGLVVGDVRIIR